MTPDSEVPDITDSRLHWQPLDGTLETPTAQWLAWLGDPGSLTEILVKRSEGQFRVEVVNEGWRTLESIEHRRLFGPVSLGHRFWSRKVLLMGRDEPWVSAHTLIPEHAFFSPLQEIRQLNSQPLGQFLFSHPQLKRSALDITPWGDNSWGRRSLFLLFGKPLLVAEFFLPSLITSSLLFNPSSD